MADKKCKYCGMMIPKEAKICPHCRKRFGLTWPAKIFIALVILGFIGYLSGPSKDTKNISNTETIKSNISETPLTIKGKKIKEKHSNWSNEICNTIAEKKIHIGMTSEQVKAAWGKPHGINTTTGTWGEHEQWVMSDSIYSSYLYFDNGILTSIQQSK